MKIEISALDFVLIPDEAVFFHTISQEIRFWRTKINQEIQVGLVMQS